MRQTVLVLVFFALGGLAGWLLLWQAGAQHGPQATSATERIRPQSPETLPQPRTAWRRTADGWEKTTWGTSRPKIRHPALHPTVVSLLQMLLAVMGLLAFTEMVKNRRDS